MQNLHISISKFNLNTQLKYKYIKLDEESLKTYIYKIENNLNIYNKKNIEYIKDLLQFIQDFLNNIDKYCKINDITLQMKQNYI